MYSIGRVQLNATLNFTMSTNPLFPGNQPADQGQSSVQRDPAVDLIRQKLASIYADEPDARQELIQDKLQPATNQHRSQHQAYMHQLSTSGKSMAEIQTAWHHYYSGLNDEQKRQVWQEFYSQSQAAKQPAITTPESTAPKPAAASHTAVATGVHEDSGYHQAGWPAPMTDSTPANTASQTDNDELPTAAIRDGLRNTVRQRAKLKPRHHIQSLLFGLGCGGLALFIVLFSFFNESFIAPFIQPSRTVNATPIIIGADGIAPNDKSEVIIPKINVQIPLDFSATSIKEDDIQKALEQGVVHYPTTVMPGQQGNAAFFGHSSNNIFNPGQYKFAFVLLHELVPGDTFYLTRDGIAYAYQVIDKKVVEPTEVDILDPIPGKAATATLITCDPPGTTLRRLAIIGEQVSPNPAGNTPGAPAPVSGGQEQDSTELPGPAPSFWHRLTGWIGN